MNKQEITLYVTQMTVTEIMPPGELLRVKHEFSHPDASIAIWRARGARVAMRYDQLRHAVMVALQASGVSVSALRDYSASKRKHSGVSKRGGDAQQRTISMFEGGE